MIKNLFIDLTKYLPSKAVPAMVRIVSLPIITRLFLPSEYGNYVFVMVTISFLSTFSGWVNMSLIRFYPAYEKNAKGEEFVGLTIKLSWLSILAISAFFVLILFSFRNYFPGQLYRLMAIGLVVFALTSFFEILLDFLRIKRWVGWYSGFYVWKDITTLLLGVALVILFHFDVDGLLWGGVLSIGLVLPFLWKIAVGRLRIISRQISLKSSFEMAKYSLPLVVGNLAAWILSLSDRYMLQFFRGAQEVGFYSISYQISYATIMSFTALFALAFNPLSMVIWEKQGYRQSQDFISKGTRYLLLLCIPAIVGISVMRYPIIMMLSTPSYYPGVKIIPFVLLGVFFLGLNKMFGSGLSFYKKTKFIMYSLIIAAFSNLALNFLFIPKYGYMAAAITTLISYALLLLLTIIFSRRFFVWQFPFRSLARSLIASLTAGTAAYYFLNAFSYSPATSLMVGIGGIIVIYTTMLFALGEFEVREKELVKQIVGRCIGSA
ncbi:MAG: polysaccharide biosynthesis C-terminal domain-containing protein [Candidatus Hodarchaeota archaeon]